MVDAGFLYLNLLESLGWESTAGAGFEQRQRGEKRVDTVLVDAGNFLGRRSWLAYCCVMRLKLLARSKLHMTYNSSFMLRIEMTYSIGSEVTMCDVFGQHLNN
jgi:hypothetical protein